MSKHNLARSAFILSLTIFFSNILGLIRDSYYSATWATQDAAFAGFMIAFTIPNLFRALFGEGAFTGAFIPTFARREQKEGEKTAWQSACYAITTMGVFLSVLIIILCGLLYYIPLCLNLSFLQETHRYALKYMPLLLPYAVFVCVAAGFTAVLNYFKFFLLPALNQIIFNSALILVIIFLCKNRSPEEGINILIYAILIIGIGQVVFLSLLCRILKKYWFLPKFSWSHPDVKEIRMLMFPILLANSVHQLNTIVDRYLAGAISAAAVNCMYYAHQLIHLPIGLFAAAMSQVCLPTLSRAYAKQDDQEIEKTFNYAIIQVLFFTLPAAMLLIGSGKAIIELLFFHGKFNIEALNLTYYIMLFYVPAIPAYAVLKIIISVFYASQNSKITTTVSIFCVVLNLVLNLILINFLDQYGLALATSISACCNNIILYMIGKNQKKLAINLNWRPIGKLLLASVCCGLSIFFLNFYITNHDLYFSIEIPFITEIKNHACQRLFISIILGGIIYLASLLAVGGYKDCLKKILEIFKR